MDEFELLPNYLVKLHSLLENTIKLFEENYIEYWLVGGSLLGLFRDNIKIKYDPNENIAIHVNDKEKLESLESKLEKLGYRCDKVGAVYVIVDPSETEKIIYYGKEGEQPTLESQYHLKSPHIFIDIYDTEFDHTAGLDKVKVMYRLSDWQNTPYHLIDKTRFNKEDLYPLIKADYNGLKVKIPNNPLPYIETYFGLDFNIHKNRFFEKYKIKLKDKIKE